MNIDGAEFIYYILPSLQINALFCYLWVTSAFIMTEV